MKRIWTHNDVFIWPTDDTDIIGAIGDTIAFEIPQGLPSFLGLTRKEVCQMVCDALNKVGGDYES